MPKKTKPNPKEMHFPSLLNHAILETRPDGEEILYFSGKYIGSRIIEDSQNNERSSFLPVLLKKVVKGMGLADVSSIDFKDNSVYLEIGACPFRREKHSGACKLMQGLFSGMVSASTGKTHRLKSVKGKKGDRKHCVFIFEEPK